MPIDPDFKITDARTRLEQRYDKLKRSRTTAPLVAVIQRFVEIDGFTLSGVLSIQLFTTVIPLIIIGFAYFSGFASNASVGDVGVPAPTLTRGQFPAAEAGSK